MKPSDFYVGVTDFFSILLPGAALTGALVHVGWVGETWTDRPPLTDQTARWVAFALCAYASGHLIFLFAALLDSPFYVWARNVIWRDQPGDAYAVARTLRERTLKRGLGPQAVLAGDRPLNTYAWAKSLLMLQWPAAAADVQRYEADSKFFRSLVVVTLLMAMLTFGEGAAGWGLLLIGLSVPCFWRYAERRKKSTQWAYQHVIVLMTAKDEVAQA
jgi:hypothetical protein